MGARAKVHGTVCGGVVTSNKEVDHEEGRQKDK